MKSKEVKVITFANDALEIENDINRWLTNNDVEILKIKYAYSVDHNSRGWSSCLIVYKK